MTRRARASPKMLDYPRLEIHLKMDGVDVERQPAIRRIAATANVVGGGGV